MITFEDRMALVRAGYTASQIAEFDNQQPEQPQPQTEQTQPQTKQPQPQPKQPQPQTKQPQPQPKQPQPQPKQPQPQTKQPDFTAMMQSINNSMAAMLAAMQAQNIKTADMREPAKETPSDILAKLLNP